MEVLGFGFIADFNVSAGEAAMILQKIFIYILSLHQQCDPNAECGCPIIYRSFLRCISVSRCLKTINVAGTSMLACSFTGNQEVEDLGLGYFVDFRYSCNCSTVIAVETAMIMLQ